MTEPSVARFPDLADRAVFITGGGSGIGAALTEGFLAQGARVAFVQRSDAGAFCDGLEARYGRRPLFIRCDVTDTAALRAAVAQAAEAHGPADVLVANAADDSRHATLEVDEAFWDRAMAINLKAYFFAAQAVLPGMIARGRGAIVNISSISYIIANPEYPVYVTANAGIVGLTRALAREFGPHGIRVNALAPGWVMTEKQRRMWVTEEALAGHLARQCIPEPLEPADVVDTVLFLSSDASRRLTGQMIAVDGGVVTTG